MSGDREGMLVVSWEADEFRAGVTQAALEGSGIEARVITDDPMGMTGVFGPTASRRVAVVVRAADAERAGELLRERAEGEGVDWDEVDVGEPEDELARRIASGRGASERGWWWGGWPAAVILLVGGFVAMKFSSAAAWVLWTAALVAGVGSAGSWVVWRIRGVGRRGSGGG